MLPPSAWSHVHRSARAIEAPLTIRPADADDRRALTALAQLDSATPLTGDALVAEHDGAPLAAIEIGTERAIADPFVPSQEVVGLLRLRARQLREAA